VPATPVTTATASRWPTRSGAAATRASTVPSATSTSTNVREIRAETDDASTLTDRTSVFVTKVSRVRTVRIATILAVLLLAKTVESVHNSTATHFNALAQKVTKASVARSTLTTAPVTSAKTAASASTA
jgi:hypothetical protein